MTTGNLILRSSKFPILIGHTLDEEVMRDYKALFDRYNSYPSLKYYKLLRIYLRLN